MKIFCKTKFKSERFTFCRKIKKLRNNQGFIFVQTAIVIPIISCTVIAILIVAGSYINAFANYLDMWIVQTETRKVMEDIIRELEYADEIYYEGGSLENKKLRIGTTRRAEGIYGEKSSIEARTLERKVKYFSYQNGGAVLYRYDLNKSTADGFIVSSKQPLTGENYFSKNKITFQCEKLAENLYLVEVEGYSYNVKKYFRLRTSVINRNAEFSKKDDEK